MRYSAIFTLCVFCSFPADVLAVEKSKPLLFANYYAWYHDGSHTARPWAGWTRKESEHNARALAEQRSGEPPRSSAAYPLAGLYDSADPEVAEWHVRLAQAAGIDAFLVDWWGTHLGRDKNIDQGILAAAEKHGFKFALLDERSQFHTDWEWYKQAAVEALARYKDSPSYLRIDGRPVYYLYQVAASGDSHAGEVHRAEATRRSQGRSGLLDRRQDRAQPPGAGRHDQTHSRRLARHAWHRLLRLLQHVQQLSRTPVRGTHRQIPAHDAAGPQFRQEDAASGPSRSRQLSLPGRPLRHAPPRRADAA